MLGEQTLSETDSITSPFSKQGYALHFPESKPIATIIFPSGRDLDATININEYELIEPIFTQVK